MLFWSKMNGFFKKLNVKLNRLKSEDLASTSLIWTYRKIFKQNWRILTQINHYSFLFLFFEKFWEKYEIVFGYLVLECRQFQFELLYVFFQIPMYSLFPFKFKFSSFKWIVISHKKYSWCFHWIVDISLNLS